jgi:hypothetical protein
MEWDIWGSLVPARGPPAGSTSIAGQELEVFRRKKIERGSMNMSNNDLVGKKRHRASQICTRKFIWTNIEEDMSSS